MVRLISYPFRFASNGAVASLEDGTDYFPDELAMLIKTVPGERELVPEYGIEDPTFNTFSTTEMIEKVVTYGPPVRIVEATSNYTTDGRIVVDVQYEDIRNDETSALSGDFDDDDYDNDDDFDDDEFDDEEDPEFGFTDATD